MAILQAGSVRRIMDQFQQAVPEVRLQYFVSNDNVLHIQVPNTFNDLPEVTRLHATSEMGRMVKLFNDLDIVVQPEVYEARNVRA